MPRRTPVVLFIMVFVESPGAGSHFVWNLLILVQTMELSFSSVSCNRCKS
jgi:hypothetical protein